MQPHPSARPVAAYSRKYPAKLTDPDSVNETGYMLSLFELQNLWRLRKESTYHFAFNTLYPAPVWETGRFCNILAV